MTTLLDFDPAALGVANGIEWTGGDGWLVDAYDGGAVGSLVNGHTALRLIEAPPSTSATIYSPAFAAATDWTLHAVVSVATPPSSLATTIVPSYSPIYLTDSGEWSIGGASSVSTGTNVAVVTLTGESGTRTLYVNGEVVDSDFNPFAAPASDVTLWAMSGVTFDVLRMVVLDEVPADLPEQIEALLEQYGDAPVPPDPVDALATSNSRSAGFAAFATDDPWAEPNLPEPEAGGSVEPPADPDARDLPESLPATSYLALLDVDGNEITGPGYARTPLVDADWEFAADDEAVTNADDIEGPTPSGAWPTVASFAIFSAASGGAPVAVTPATAPIVPTPGVPIQFIKNTVVANVLPDPVIRYVTEVMPEPDLDNGRPVNWEPFSSTSANWGKLQIIVEGTDISYLLGAATPFPTITEVEPFGYASATIRLPQVTTFVPLGSGALSWCKQGANVRIRVKKRSHQGGGYVDLFRGFIESPTVSEDGGGVTLECTGLLFQADKTICAPSLSPRVRDCGRVIADLLNAVPGRRYSRMERRNTGIKTYTTGSWEPTLTGAVQQLLATMLDKNGRQWTVMPDGREPVLRKKRQAIHWSIRAGQRGVTVDLERELVPNAIYGEGVNERGGRWRNAKYPNWGADDAPLFPMAPNQAFRVGTRDSNTTTGSGVSDWQEQAGRPVTGVYSRADADACRDLQREAGIQVDGTVGPQTWAATFATGSNTGTLDGAYIAPLAASPKVEPRLRGPRGADLGPNPEYDPDVIRVEEAISFGQNVSKSEARAWARRTMSRGATSSGMSTYAYHGRVRFEIDPAEGHRLEVVRAGTNGVIEGVHGEDVLVHVAHVTMSAGGRTGIVVTATVDTEARDYPTLDAIRTRERNAVDPAKAFIRRRGGQDTMSPRATFDAESPAGRLPKHALFPNLWTVVQVPFGDYGRVVRTSIRTESSASPFALAVFSKPVTAARLLSLVGNPLTAESNPWSANADDLEGAGLLMAWGWNKQPAGYYPGSFNAPDGESSDPVTGRLVDDSAWEFASERSPWVWVASIATSGCTISGRFYQGAI